MEVEVVNRQRARRVAATPLAAFLRAAAREVPAEGAASVGVALVGDAAMRDLNRRYRGKDATTDVLSFPSGRAPAPGGRHLGDIVISVPRAAQQAREAGHALGRELRLLLLHGWLHLLGYDHETDDGRMRRLERRVARRLLP